MFDDHLRTLASQLGEQLKKNKYMLTLAESCTGGLVSALITDIPGSSEWFDSGLVTYSNQAKRDLLGVSMGTLKTHGAVSEITAVEMALGALKQNRANLSASITGIAGPGGGTPQKPVGHVCFAWAATMFPTTSRTEQLQGNRQQIRLQAAAICIEGLLAMTQDQTN